MNHCSISSLNNLINCNNILLFKKTFWASLIIILSLFANDIFAQANDDHNKPDRYDLNLEQLGKIVITASKTPKLISDITQKIDIVTENQMHQIIMNNRNIAELIQYLPGASVNVLSRNDVNWGAYGGIGPKYNTYLLQGLPIDGSMDPTSIDAILLQRIEVQRGPASVLYPNYLSQDFAGNQGSLGGTVNLLLKEDVSIPKSTFVVDYGSYQTYSSKLYHEDRLGKFNIFGGISYEKSNYTNYGSTDSWLNMLKNPEYQKGKLFLGTSFFLDDSLKHKITIMGNQSFQWGDVGRIYRKFDYRYGLLNFGYTGQIINNLNVAFRTGLRSYNRSWQDDFIDPNNVQSLKATNSVKQFIVPADISFSFNHFSNSNLTVGSDYQYSTYLTSLQPLDSNTIDGNDASTHQLGLYVQEEMQLNKLTLRAGGRFNYTGQSVNKFEDQPRNLLNKSWNVFLWSAGAKYRLSDELTLFANGGSSFMLPGLKSIGGTLLLSDMFKPGKDGQLPNYNLNPENGIGYDAGVDCKLYSDIFLSVRGFLSTITNAIIDNVISQNPSQTMSVNADGKTLTKGVEISLKQQTLNSLNWFANITLTSSKISNPDNPDLDGVDVPFVPKIMGNVGITFSPLLDFEFSPYIHWGGGIYDSNSKTNRRYFNSGELFNLIISKPVSLNQFTKMNAYVKLYNITNNKFNMPFQFIDPGFSWTLGCSVDF